MITETIPIWNSGNDALMQCYRWNPSHELSAIMRRPAAIICPGGAYLATSDREAEPVALRFLAKGYQAFVLRYNTFYGTFDPARQGEGNPRTMYPQPLLDLARAVAIVREHADEWQIDPDQIVVVGFSAGGHLAASLGVHWHEPFLRERLGVDSALFKPNALVLGYALLDYMFMLDQYEQYLAHKRREEQSSADARMKERATPDRQANEPSGDRPPAREPEAILQMWRQSNQAVFGTPEPTREQLLERSPVYHIGEQTPPTFLWHTFEDDLVDAQHSLMFAMELAKHGIPCEFHLFESGPHGLSLADETTASTPWQHNPHVAGWMDLAFAWLGQRFGLQRKTSQ